MDKPGMIILLVNTESPAWKGDLKVGDIIMEIDGQRINNIKDYQGAIENYQSGMPLKITFVRKG